MKKLPIYLSAIYFLTSSSFLFAAGSGDLDGAAEEVAECAAAVARPALPAEEETVKPVSERSDAFFIKPQEITPSMHAENPQLMLDETLRILDRYNAILQVLNFMSEDQIIEDSPLARAKREEENARTEIRRLEDKQRAYQRSRDEHLRSIETIKTDLENLRRYGEKAELAGYKQQGYPIFYDRIHIPTTELSDWAFHDAVYFGEINKSHERPEVVIAAQKKFKTFWIPEEARGIVSRTIEGLARIVNAIIEELSEREPKEREALKQTEEELSHVQEQLASARETLKDMQPKLEALRAKKRAAKTEFVEKDKGPLHELREAYRQYSGAASKLAQYGIKPKEQPLDLIKGLFEESKILEHAKGVEGAPARRHEFLERTYNLLDTNLPIAKEKREQAEAQRTERDKAHEAWLSGGSQDDDAADASEGAGADAPGMTDA